MKENSLEEQIIDSIYSKKESKLVDFLSTNCTVLDLVLGGGFPSGRMVNIVGDKSTGKTLISSEFIASNYHKLKNDFQFLYDDVEAGYNFDSNEIYGLDILDDKFVPSSTVEEFEYNIENFLSKKKSKYAFYFLDSFDALSSEKDSLDYQKKLNGIKKKIEENKVEKQSGSFQMYKQKEIKSFFKETCRKMRDSNTSLVIISQVGMNIGVMFGEKYIRAGGKSLDFFASQIVWLSEVEKITKKDRAVGVRIKARVKKNKVGKPFRECFFDILFDYGIDDVTSNVNYFYDLLTPTGKLNKKKIKWDDKEFTPLGLVKHIEENHLEEILKQKVVEKWNDIEEQISVKDRKKKF